MCCFSSATRRGTCAHRDPVEMPAGLVRLYHEIGELRGRWRQSLSGADLVIVDSYVPEGMAVVRLVKSLAGGIVAFYDIDTPVSLAGLGAGNCPYLAPEMVPVFDLYLSIRPGRFPILSRTSSPSGRR